MPSQPEFDDPILAFGKVASRRPLQHSGQGAEPVEPTVVRQPNFTTVADLMAELAKLPPDMLVATVDNEWGNQYEDVKPVLEWVRKEYRPWNGETFYTYSKRDVCPQRPLHDTCDCANDVQVAVIQGN
ncbi:hypothetical protein SEA_HORUS_47 [Gordonia phage Horus]|uniref:Uncharacterized protein n=1 Tax=Gordonia phage Horus TaxID=2301696 RepID=A0A385DZI4_9CAUD|nr:hypothetical protein HOT93_gp103 [Gordonia phage Horus]AXQ63899.1 hypothetical protein SEA_HORUS_47 [Gordonia phage Horus]WNM69756.1 hypothetical protein SEA_CRATER_48 [Gordonia phage Crater]